MAGFGPNDWIWQEIALLPMGVFVIVAGWARPRWLQWAAAIASFAAIVALAVAYAIPVG